MAVYVSDLLTAIPAPVDVAPASAQTWQWLRSSTAISGATGGTYTTTLADLGTTLAVTQTETNFLGAASATSANTEVVQAYDPNALFRFSEPGVWFDPNDITTLFRGPTPYSAVTAPGDTVALMLDKSKGGPGPELVVNGNFSAGTTGWTAVSSTISVDEGRLRIITNTTSGFAYQSFTTVVGRTYLLVYSLTNGDATGCYMFIDPAAGLGAANYDSGAKADGTYTAAFVATATTTYVKPFITGNGKFAFYDNISIREVLGNHATQPTLASQPTYGIVPAGGRRNISLYSQGTGMSAAWGADSPGSSTRTDNAVVDPTGQLTAMRFVTASSAYPNLSQNVTFTTAGTHRVSFWAKVPSGTLSTSGFTFTDTWQRFSTTITSTVGTSIVVLFNLGPSAAIGVEIHAWGAQVEAGSLMTPYQRVGTTYDVTEAGVPSLGYLQFNGINNSMATPTITPGIDKAQAFTGVRKFVDAPSGAVFEFGNLASDPGMIAIHAPNQAVGLQYRWSLRNNAGTVTDLGPTTGYAAPITSILTGTGDISGDRSTIRINGTQFAQSTADQGTGNFQAYPLYIGARVGGSLYLNGQMYPMIVRFGTNLTAARITATENWMATQTPLQWTVGSGFWNDAYPWSDISAWRD